MLPRNRGTIVQVGSALAYRGIPLQARLLRRQARDPGLHRVGALRAAARRQRGARDHGAAAGAEHAAVRVGAEHACRATPQPVPPIYQPEVAAGRSSGAAQQRRREIWVGGSTARRSSATSWRPSLGDWYLGQDRLRRPAERRPVAADRPTTCSAGRRAATAARTGASTTGRTRRSAQLWATTHRRGLLAGAGLAAAAALGGLRRRS